MPDDPKPTMSDASESAMSRALGAFEGQEPSVPAAPVPGPTSPETPPSPPIPTEPEPPPPGLYEHPRRGQLQKGDADALIEYALDTLSRAREVVETERARPPEKKAQPVPVADPVAAIMDRLDRLEGKQNEVGSKLHQREVNEMARDLVDEIKGELKGEDFYTKLSEKNQARAVGFTSHLIGQGLETKAAVKEVALMLAEIGREAKGEFLTTKLEASGKKVSTTQRGGSPPAKEPEHLSGRDFRDGKVFERALARAEHAQRS